MADSFSFDGVDMSAYGLRLRMHDEPFEQETESAQLRDRAYGGGSVRPGKGITLDVAISAANIATLKSYLDSIKSALNKRGDCALAIDTFSDRYWLARFAGIRKSNSTATAWEGQIDFVAHDPAALASSETSSNFSIDADPKQITETAGGTERVSPVLMLTCDATLAATTVGIENTATGETVEWTGDLVASDVLEIDCEKCVVKLNGAEDMLPVSGIFPQLLPGSNVINVSGFSGSLNIAYRARYA